MNFKIRLTTNRSLSSFHNFFLVKWNRALFSKFQLTNPLFVETSKADKAFWRRNGRFRKELARSLGVWINVFPASANFHGIVPSLGVVVQISRALFSKMAGRSLLLEHVWLSLCPARRRIRRAFIFAASN